MSKYSTVIVALSNNQQNPLLLEALEKFLVGKIRKQRTVVVSKEYFFSSKVFRRIKVQKKKSKRPKKEGILNSDRF